MRNITITVYDYEKCGSGHPDNLVEHIAWLQEKLEGIPEDFRDSAYVDINGYESYGSGVLHYTIEYKRPETDEEKAARESREQARDEKIRKDELATLERLKTKYEPTPTP